MRLVGRRVISMEVLAFLPSGGAPLMLSTPTRAPSHLLPAML